MSEEIGKISKPQADNVQLKRKLYLVQNIQKIIFREIKILKTCCWNIGIQFQIN